MYIYIYKYGCIRSIRTSHRYEFRVLQHCTKPPSRTRASPFPKRKREALAREGGSSAKSESLAGGPYSSYLQLASLIRGLGGNSRDAKCAQIAKSFSHPFRQSKMNCKFGTRPNPGDDLRLATYFPFDWRPPAAVRKPPACPSNLQFIFHGR